MVTFKICQKSIYKLINNEIIKNKVISLPDDEPDMKNKVFYIWFDPPIDYISVGDDWEKWPKNH